MIKKLIILIISMIILVASIPYALAQTDNGTDSTSQNFSMAQNAGNKVFNQMMCNMNPSYCPGGSNAP